MPSRPRLKPSFQPVRRGAGTVQLGLTPESGGVLLAGLDPAEIGLLERLDGSLSEPDLYALAAGWGVPRRRARELLRLLRERGLLVDRPAPSGPDPSLEDRHVVLAGAGLLADTIAAVLRDGGVGRVSTGRWASDLAEAELRAALAPRPASLVHRGPHLVVSTGAVGGLDARGGLDPRGGQAWRLLGVPVLPIAADAARVVIGPLVAPLAGSDPRDACLACLDLARAEGERSWPPPPADADEPPGAEGPGVALAAVAAGAVAMVVDAVLRGDPVPAGVSIETRLPWPRFDHRRWERHPACPAHTHCVPNHGGLG